MKPGRGFLRFKGYEFDSIDPGFVGDCAGFGGVWSACRADLDGGRYGASCLDFSAR